MLVGILKVTCISAPERSLRPLEDTGTSGFCLGHDGIDLRFRGDVMPQREIGWTWARNRQPRIVGQAPARPQRKPQPRLHVKECHGTVFELLAHDPFGTKSQSIRIEALT